MICLIFANGEPFDGPMVRKWLTHADTAYILAADGGANVALGYGLMPQRVVGDMDSVIPATLDELTAHGVELVRLPAEKDETDLELALLDAAAQGADPIIIIGGAGGRLDHMLANVYLLALPALEGRTVHMVAGRQEITLLRPGMHAIVGRAGDTVSLLPIGGAAHGVRTEALAYPLHGETLHFGPARGVSNVMQAARAHVSFDAGWLLLIHTEGRA